MPKENIYDDLMVAKLRQLAENRDPHGWVNDFVQGFHNRNSLEAQVGASKFSQEYVKLIHDAIETSYDGRPLTAPMRAGLESIIDESLPVLPVQENMFKVPGGDWDLLGNEPINSHVNLAIKATGRINFQDQDSGELKYGTGFLLGPNLIGTNRHVAQEFCDCEKLEIRCPANIHFKVEIGSDAAKDRKLDSATGSDIAQIVKPVLIHPFWDFAVLEIKFDCDEHNRGYLVLETAPSAAGRAIVVGHPQHDGSGGYNLQTTILGGWDGVKRVQVGRTGGLVIKEHPKGTQVEAITHNATTLSSNSGSPLISTSTGAVVGIHFGGSYLDNNYAVPAQKLALDDTVLKAGVKFHTNVPPTSFS